MFRAEWLHRLQMTNEFKTGVIVIILGYMNFIVVPLATIFGRRPVSIICAIIVLVSNIWQGAAQSYGSFMGARVIAGLGGGGSSLICSLLTLSICVLTFRASQQPRRL